MDNRFSVYRDIRYKRTYRTIGKMSWWRIVLGIILIVFVVLLSGWPSQLLAAREEFHAAQKLMISPEWMEEYKPETKAFIEAGVLYQDGKLEDALSAFELIEDFDAAYTMKSRTALKLSAENLDTNNFDKVYEFILKVDFSQLTDDEADSYIDVCSSLAEHFSAIDSEDAKNRADELESLITAHLE